MKLKLDENMPAAMLALLREAGYDATSAVEEGLGGAGDPRIMAAACGEGCTLLTFDLDFADVRKFPVGSHAGVVVFRLKDQRWASLEGPARRLVAGGVLARIIHDR